VSDSKLN